MFQNERNPSKSGFLKLTSDLVQGKLRGDNQWYLDSGCSKHMTGDKYNFLSLTALHNGSVTFGDNKKGKIVGIGKIGKSPTHSIDNVYLVKGLKHNLLSISQFCDKGNIVTERNSAQSHWNDKQSHLEELVF